MSDYDDGYMNGRASLDDRIEKLDAQLASLLRVAEAAREIVEYVRTANLAGSKLLNVKAEYNDGDSYNLNGPFIRLKQALAALPAPGERKEKA